MALTFEEVEAFISGIGAQSFRVVTTIIRTQEDGRTGYSTPWATSFNKKSLELATAPPEEDFPEYFSDRLGPTVNGNILGVFDTHATDPLRYQFQRRAPNEYILKLQLPRWGASLEVPMSLAPNAKLYTGWGPRIQGGNDKALFAVSFQSAALLII